MQKKAYPIRKPDFRKRKTKDVGILFCTNKMEAICDLWWVCVNRSLFLSLTDKSPPPTVILPRVSLILFKPICECILLEAAICRPSILPEKSFWSGSNTIPSTLRPGDALFDFMAISTLAITKFSIAVNTASWSLVSTVVITLSTSLRILLTMFSSNVCISTCGVLTLIRLFILFGEIATSTTLVLLPAWVSWLLCAIKKPASHSLNWVKSLLFFCFFFRVETKLKLINALTNSKEQVNTNWKVKD